MKYLEEIGNNKNRLFVECFNGYACRFFYQGHDLIHGGSFPEKYRTKEDNLRIEKGAPEYSNITVFPFGGSTFSRTCFRISLTFVFIIYYLKKTLYF
ncbi:MAG: hypothetical protein P8X70_00550 [Nanoarchaeota archaeon]